MAEDEKDGHPVPKRERWENNRFNEIDTKISELELLIKNAPPNGHLRDQIRELEKKVEDLEMKYDQGHGQRIENLEGMKEDLFTRQGGLAKLVKKKLSELKEMVDSALANDILFAASRDELKDRVDGIYKSVHGIEPDEVDKLKEEQEKEHAFVSTFAREVRKNREVLREFRQWVRDLIFFLKWTSNLESLEENDMTLEELLHRHDYTKLGGDSAFTDTQPSKDKWKQDIGGDSEKKQCPNCGEYLKVDINTLNSGYWYCEMCDFKEDIGGEKDPRLALRPTPITKEKPPKWGPAEGKCEGCDAYNLECASECEDMFNNVPLRCEKETTDDLGEHIDKVIYPYSDKHIVVERADLLKDWDFLYNKIYRYLSGMRKNDSTKEISSIINMVYFYFESRKKKYLGEDKE